MRAAVAAALLLVALPAVAGTPGHGTAGTTASGNDRKSVGDARVLEEHGKWESGYGVKFYNVVGKLRNTSDHPLAYVKLHVEAVDGHGKVVASTDAYNESAEMLTIPEANPAVLLSQGKVKPLAPGADERFRASFLQDETPPFVDHRVRVIAAPAAKP